MLDVCWGACAGMCVVGLEIKEAMCLVRVGLRRKLRVSSCSSDTLGLLCFGLDWFRLVGGSHLSHGIEWLGLESEDDSGRWII